MELVRQNFVKRLIAAIIDGVILVVAGFVVGLALAKLPYVMGVVSAAIGVAYMSLEVIKAQTIGKMVLKLKITNADGSAASQAVLLKRFAIKNSASLIVLVGAIVGLPIIGMVAMLPGLAVLVGCFLVLRPDHLAGH
ncbi:MAG: hypothetical protein JWM57_166, partial [Phycisphaerales bacterium]|nr:hypothetical protein [Phycisphaerales bacterium]